MKRRRAGTCDVDVPERGSIRVASVSASVVPPSFHAAGRLDDMVFPVAYPTPRPPPTPLMHHAPPSRVESDVHPTSTQNSGVAECPISSGHLAARRDPSRQQPEHD